MRDCPSCNYAHRQDLGAYEDIYHVYACLACGMRYLDGPEASQARLDAYYGSGDTSPDLQGQDSLDRLMSLANRALGAGRVLDVGGTYSPLRKIIACDTKGPADAIEGIYDLVILSHTLEHVYDVNALMDEIVAHSRTGTRILIEIPFWTDYEMPNYDHFWQHVNKFRAGDVERLLHRFGYAVRTAIRLPDFQGFKCYRVEGELI